MLDESPGADSTSDVARTVSLSSTAVSASPITGTSNVTAVSRTSARPRTRNQQTRQGQQQTPSALSTPPLTAAKASPQALWPWAATLAGQHRILYGHSGSTQSDAISNMCGGKGLLETTKVAETAKKTAVSIRVLVAFGKQLRCWPRVLVFDQST